VPEHRTETRHIQKRATLHLSVGLNAFKSLYIVVDNSIRLNCKIYTPPNVFWRDSMSHLFNFTSDRWGFVVRTHMRDQNAPETAVYSESEPRLCMLWSPKSYRLVHRGVTKYNMRIKNDLTTKVCTRRHFVNIKNISLTRCNRHIERIVLRTVGIIIPINPLRNACKTCLAIWCQMLIGFISHCKTAEEQDM